MSFLPYIDSTNQLVDGTCFHLLPFCKTHCNSDKCKAHYIKMSEASTGSYCCPHGLTSYVYEGADKKIVFSGIRVKEFYDRKKSKSISAQECVYNPVIDESTCISIAKEIALSLFEKRELEEKLEAIRDLLHETRSLNGQSKNHIDVLWESNNDESSIEPNVMLETLKNVHVSSFMISNRFAYFDSILNPTLSSGEPYPANIFKKFDKMRKLLKGYLRKNVWISIDTDEQITYKYNIYPSFETLLFIILENAIKYSPPNLPVDVSLKEKDALLDVTISSTGPYCEENEILRLCDKGFRSENAKIMQKSGQGFGLNFAKKICETHNIQISFKSEYSHKDHGVKYGKFSVSLHFDNNI